MTDETRPEPGLEPRPSVDAPPEPQPGSEPQPLSRREARREQEAQQESAPPPAAPSAPGTRLEVTGEWRRVSPKYVAVEFVQAVVSSVVLLITPVVLLLIGVGWAWIALAVAAALALTLLIVAPRRARSYGYLLRADDLLFRRGIMFQRFVSVPYGRMQLIDVNRGPLARALGLADLRFVTAAAATGVSIPGLVEAEAEELRDRLVALAESRRAGL
ncbi:PH domain-containing protein [Rathayibacter sp. ZW T2_19]|uniref:PH domain-containing protein n=1 Tax=Rathayibacter rubneri TaxID=2950106 RepID=A0A9X2IU43_9MICO|nr:PH domain-containing protein [Rathayibacter rubneri]MCM6763198.1 PH domain-containing protein [Rathayibacter rubneri]